MAQVGDLVGGEADVTLLDGRNEGHIMVRPNTRKQQSLANSQPTSVPDRL